MDLNDYFRNEEKCIQYFIKKRWNGHVTCLHKRCQNTYLTIINQLAKDIRVKQQTAWFVLQRIREAMKNDNDNEFDGTTEIDEAYIGGSETNKHADKKNKIPILNDKQRASRIAVKQSVFDRILVKIANKNKCLFVSNFVVR